MCTMRALAESSFSDAKLLKSAFTNVNLKNSSFTDVDLSGASFTNVNLPSLPTAPDDLAEAWKNVPETFGRRPDLASVIRSTEIVNISLAVPDLEGPNDRYGVK
jgi:hypothetical protein